MGHATEDAKGRVKEAAGDLTNDKSLEREGKADQAGAKAKDVVDNVKDKATDAIDATKDKLTNDR